MSSLLEQYLRDLNPATALEDAVADNYQRNMSLLEQKKVELSGKATEKQARMDPEAALAAYRTLIGSNGDSGLADLAQSSVLRLGGDLADVGRWGSNAIFGTNFDDSEATGWSNQATTDEMAGVSQEYRADLQGRQGNVMDQLRQGNWGSALAGGVAVGLETAADSTGSIVGLLGGGVPRLGVKAAAGIAGAGTRLLTGADKVENVVDAAADAAKVKKATLSTKEASDAVDAADKAARTGKAASQVATAAVEAERIKKSTTALAKGINLAKTAGKNAEQVSLITAQIVQQNRNEFREANPGQDYTLARTATDVVMTLASTIWQPSIVKNLLVPGLVKSTVTNSAGAVIKNPTVLQQIGAEAASMMRYVEKGAIPSILERVAKGVGSVVAAGGAEGLQEYMQTWAGILATKVGMDEAQSLMASIAETVGDRENQLSAAAGGILGVGAGGAIRSVSAVPSVALGTVADTVKGTVKTAGAAAGRNLQNKLASRLTPEQVESRAAEDEARAVEKQNIIDRNAPMIVEAANAKTFEDITNEELRDRMIKTAGTADLNDPKDFQKVKNQVTSTLRAEPTKVVISSAWGDTKRQASRAGHAALQAAKDAAEYAGITPEKFDEYTEKAKDLGIAAWEDLKTLNDSTTYGLSLAAVDFSKKASSAGLKKLKAAAYGADPDFLTDLADWAAKHYPDSDTPKVLNKLAKQLKTDLVTAGIRKEQTTDSENMPSAIGEARQAKVISDSNANALGLLISDIAKGDIGDAEAADTLLKTLDKYAESDWHKSGKGKLTDARIGKIRTKFELSKKRHQSETVEAVKRGAEKAGDAVKGAAKAVSDKVDLKSVSAWFDDLFVKTLNGQLFKSKGKTPDEATADTDKSPGDTAEQLADELSKGAREFFDKVKTRYKEYKDANDSESVGYVETMLVTDEQLKRLNHMVDKKSPQKSALKLLGEIAPSLLSEENIAATKSAIRDFYRRVKSRELDVTTSSPNDIKEAVTAGLAAAEVYKNSKSLDFEKDIEETRETIRKAVGKEAADVYEKTLRDALKKSEKNVENDIDEETDADEEDSVVKAPEYDDDGMLIVNKSKISDEDIETDLDENGGEVKMVHTRLSAAEVEATLKKYGVKICPS
jgi:hypothetical protein